MSELPGNDIQYPPGMNAEHKRHVGATADDSAGLGCADCDGHLNGGCVTVCLACAYLRERSAEAMCNRMRKICVALDKAHELTRKLGSQSATAGEIAYEIDGGSDADCLQLSISRAVTLGKLFGALATVSANIPETIRRQAATPPEVTI